MSQSDQKSADPQITIITALSSGKFGEGGKGIENKQPFKNDRVPDKDTDAAKRWRSCFADILL